MTVSKDGETFLTTDETAEFLKVTRQTVNRLVREKRLKQYKQSISKIVYYKKTDLEALNEIRPVEEVPQSE